ncbi:unnamed protein product [Orchesella dallaii]|uniref:Uncharacterized protein n=1 Tax=Orchesella dallaii TaxID=48710 RepID=A0ABP1PNV1_9HEXA
MNTFIAVITIVVTVSTVVGLYLQQTPDGCPFSFDMGIYELVYAKPGFCDKLIPESTVAAPQKDEPPFWIKMYYTDDPSVFRVKLASTKDISLSDVWLTTSKVFPNNTIRSSIAVGYFLQTLNFDFYCCDWTRKRTVARRSSTRRTGNFSCVNILWSPLNYSGRAIVRANVFITGETWYSNIQSKPYVFPPQMPSFLLPTQEHTLVEHWNDTESDEYEYEEDIIDLRDIDLDNKTNAQETAVKKENL